jgi:hypothetical protein
MRTLKPTYDHRFSIDHIRASYASPNDMFERGDFMLAAEFAEPSSELKASALILAGLLEQGLELFNRLESPSPEAVLHAAFAYWSLKQDNDALVLLASIGGASTTAEPAHRLTELINKPEIRVFVTAAHVPIFTGQAESAWKAVSHYDNFTVAHVGSQLSENAYSYELSQPFDEFIENLPENRKPDFIFALTPQWILPCNFEKVKIPKVIWCHDTDIFLYRAHENLAQYDVRIVMISQEHYELSKILGGRCVSNIMSSTLCSPFPEVKDIPKSDKDIDILFTGAALMEFTSEKARFVYLLSELAPEYKICVVDGHLDEQKYFKLLERTKFLPIVNRYCGCPSPRWRDALCFGANLFYPEHTLYGEIVAGCHPFRAGGIPQDLRKHLDNYASGQSAYDPSAIFSDASKRFAIHRQSRDEIFLRLLKFTAFCTLVQRQLPSIPVRKPRNRLVWLTPTIDAWIFGPQVIRSKASVLADGLAARAEWDEKDFNNAASFCRKLYATFVDATQERSAWNARAESFLQKGIERFPNSLLLRFNLAHWRYHDRGGADIASIAGFTEIIDHFDQFDFDPIGSDVGLGFPLHETDRVFPYYDYGQLIIKRAVLAQSSRASPAEDNLLEPANILLSAAHGYIGLSKLHLGDSHEAFARFDTALAIYPDNLPLLRLRLQRLIEFLAARPEDDIDNLNRLVDAFFDCAEKWPAILLDEIEHIAPVLATTKRFDELRFLLLRWYRMASIIFYRDPDKRLEKDLPRLQKITAFYEFFPPEAKAKMDRISSGETTEKEITQFDQFLNLALLKERIMSAHHTAGHFNIFGQSVNELPSDKPSQAVGEDVLQNEIRQLRERYQEAELRRQEAELGRQASERQFLEIENSTIWRSTRPLRTILRLIRRN